MTCVNKFSENTCFRLRLVLADDLREQILNFPSQAFHCTYSQFLLEEQISLLLFAHLHFTEACWEHVEERHELLCASKSMLYFDGWSVFEHAETWIEYVQWMASCSSSLRTWLTLSRLNWDTLNQVKLGFISTYQIQIQGILVLYFLGWNETKFNWVECVTQSNQDLQSIW
jgi:hypothetical protein